jgi:hypothetical protein
VVRIWVRATLDYDDAAAFAAQLRPAFREQVALWDALFTMPFRVFRSRVRAIARSNLELVEGAVVSSWDDIAEGELVLPCDDDDWFAPCAAAAVAAAAEPDAPGVRWASSFLEVPVDWRHQLGIWRARVLGPRARFICTTNNYALRKSSAGSELLDSHVRAGRWVRAQPPGAVPALDDRLSLMNRTLASQTSLGWLDGPRGRRNLVGKLPRYRALYRRRLPPGLAWAQPHADAMRALMDELELRW